MGGGKTNLNNASSKKKCIISGLTGIIIGTIITGGLGVTAITLTAKEITYTPEDTNITVTNADEALNELYKIASDLEQNSNQGYTLFNLEFGGSRSRNEKYGLSVGAYGSGAQHVMTLDTTGYSVVELTNIIMTNTSQYSSLYVRITASTIGDVAVRHAATAGTTTVPNYKLDVSGVDSVTLNFVTPSHANLHYDASSTITIDSIKVY